jgi:pathogenicity locus Cdd1 protein
MPRIRKRSPRVADVPVRARGLLELPNVGPATALDLVKLGIFEPKQLARRDPETMYEALCKLDGVRHDPCLLDVFASVVAFVHGAPARPWWAYTPARKAKRRPKA